MIDGRPDHTLAINKVPGRFRMPLPPAGHFGCRAFPPNTTRSHRFISDISAVFLKKALRNADRNSRMTAVCRPTSVPERKQMAKTKEKTNKAALVREMLKAHKGKMPAEISVLLKTEKGIDIPAAYISVVKSQAKGRRKARKIVSRIAGPSGESAALFAAAELVVKAGGIAQAQAALDAVKKVAAIMV
jgi:hypothetical protein